MSYRVDREKKTQLKNNTAVASAGSDDIDYYSGAFEAW